MGGDELGEEADQQHTTVYLDAQTASVSFSCVYGGTVLKFQINVPDWPARDFLIFTSDVTSFICRQSCGTPPPQSPLVLRLTALF